MEADFYINPVFDKYLKQFQKLLSDVGLNFYRISFHGCTRALNEKKNEGKKIPQ